MQNITLAEGTLKVVHVNRNSIQHNAKHSDTLPIWRVEHGKETIYCDEVLFHGESVTVYRPNKPRKCGAKVWIETGNALSLFGVRERTDNTCEI